MIELTQEAKEQLSLIKKYDYTLDQMSLRVKISGKHCYGFSYEFLFSEKEKEDKVINLGDYVLYLDPFTSQYFKKGLIDFKNHEFVVINHEESLYHGKFFLKQ